MLGGHQSTGTEDVAGFNALVAAFLVPAQLNAALQQAEHAVTGFTGAEDQLTRWVLLDLTLAGKGTHGVKGVHAGMD
jgi:hypothetical protein